MYEIVFLYMSQITILTFADFFNINACAEYSIQLFKWQ